MNSQLPKRPIFFADAMLGTLARWLRVLGFDVLYEAHIDDATLVERAADESRVILTRDRRLVERRMARNHLLIESDLVEQQVLQVVDQLELDTSSLRAFGRCLECNTTLEPIAANAARQRVPPYVAATQKMFRRCSTCDRIFWRATHVAEMEDRLRALGLQIGRSDV